MAGRRRRRGRRVDGILVVNKPQGWSSNDAVQEAKRLYGAAKVGHTGSLDPLATGVLPLCFGEATKFSQFLLSSDKRYWTRIKLGVVTETGDADGDVVSECDARGVRTQDIEQALRSFRGEIQQVPSMYSALKHNGQPLYKLARAGIEVERKPRCVTLFSNELVRHDADELELELHCSKGTYIRTIAEDLGEALGVGAHVTALHRRSAGPYTEQEAVTFDFLAAEREKGSLDGFLLPVSSAVRQWPRIVLNEAMAFYMRQGQPVLVPRAPTGGWVQLYAGHAVEDEACDFLGVGEVLDDGRVAPRRLVVDQG